MSVRSVCVSILAVCIPIVAHIVIAQDTDDSGAQLGSLRRRLPPFVGPPGDTPPPGPPTGTPPPPCSTSNCLTSCYVNNPGTEANDCACTRTIPAARYPSTTWSKAPTCMIGTGPVYVADILVDDLLGACDDTDDGIGRICVDTPCQDKLIDNAYVYATTAFQWNPSGLRSSALGVCYDTCGMAFNVSYINTDDELCYRHGNEVVNEHELPFCCTDPVDSLLSLLVAHA